jgi:ligand-binding SRPBCC domain-containing protein
MQHSLSDYVLRRQAFIPAPLEEVFEFFSDTDNLERITPDWLHFRVLTKGPIEMKVGARIRYRLRIGGVPVRWDTRITRWEPGKSFVDRQERGPYRCWDHTHTFEARGNGVLMCDIVRYALPFGPLGRLAHALWVRGALARIFDYRFEQIGQIFGAR